MPCGEVRDLLPLLAAGPLDPSEADAVTRHLESGCPSCAGELAALKAASDLLPWSTSLEEPPPALREKLLRRVRAEDAAIRPAPAPAPSRRIARTPAWIGAAAAAMVAAVAGSVATYTYVGARHTAEVAALLARLDRQGAQIVELTRKVEEARGAIRLASAPGVRIADLSGQAERASSSARVFWDPEGASWRLYARQLPRPEPGRTYQLWLITATEKISAGTFEGGVDEAIGSASLPASAGPIVAMAVTSEPAGGSPQPTGSILLLGKI
jgi:anti-sigma-K factor RskA